MDYFTTNIYRVMDTPFLLLIALFDCVLILYAIFIFQIVRDNNRMLKKQSGEGETLAQELQHNNKNLST